ncbi:MAG: adenylate/guanylate cyclase domain-containing protein [Rhodobacteraceae bacterium]|nr:adenylate/guanylate cyclase domain-containing protein [Paracoccaceae bacterium]
MERKLSTILALDVVGFSKLMATDEDMTLAILRQRRELIDQIIIEHGGRMFGSAGDSVISEFASPVKATECAVQIQSKMLAINENIPESQKMRFRVGINIGDVMISDDNLFGDAINVAARLEAEAQPEGICISKSVFEMVSDKVKASFENAGKLELKNIELPVEAYFVIQSKGAARFLQHSDTPALKLEKAEAGSLAVTMFKSLSSDEEQGYFCEGFSEDLVSALSRFNKFFVVSTAASFAYRDKSKSPKEIGQELGVRYILEGSVRKLGSKMRISASLIAAERENTVWSNKFDTTMDEIFDIQDELVETIVSTLVGRVEAEEEKQLSLVRPENLAAYDLVLQGLVHHRRSGVTQENAQLAYDHFSKATKLDPNYARAHAWKACSLSNLVSWKPDAIDFDWFAECNKSVSKALEIDGNDPEAHRIMGAIKLNQRDYQASRYHHDKAKSLCPSDYYISAKCAEAYYYMGDPQEALEEIKRAMRLNPFCPDLVFEDEGIIHFWLESYYEALESFNKLKSPTVKSLFYSAATQAKLKNKEKAQETLSQAFTQSGLSLEQFIESQKYKNQEQTDDLCVTIGSIID